MTYDTKANFATHSDRAVYGGNVKASNGSYFVRLGRPAFRPRLT